MFNVGARAARYLDKLSISVERFLRNDDLAMLRGTDWMQLSKEINALILKYHHNLPYVSCPACEKFEREIECYCMGTGWLTLDEYKRLLRDHPEASALFDTEDVSWMIPHPSVSLRYLSHGGNGVVLPPPRD